MLSHHTHALSFDPVTLIMRLAKWVVGLELWEGLAYYLQGFKVCMTFMFLLEAQQLFSKYFHDYRAGTLSLHTLLLKIFKISSEFLLSNPTPPFHSICFQKGIYMVLFNKWVLNVRQNKIRYKMKQHAVIQLFFAFERYLTPQFNFVCTNHQNVLHTL